jgi:hypothetical protein
VTETVTETENSDKAELYPYARLINIQNEKNGHQNIRTCQELWWIALGEPHDP